MTRCTFLLCAILFALCGAPPCVWAKVDVSQKTASGIFSITYEESVWVDDAGTLENAGRASRCDYELASGLRKWPSEDPIGESGGPNLYAYVGNGPTGAIDPLGLDELLIGPDQRSPMQAGYPPSPKYTEMVASAKAAGFKVTVLAHANDIDAAIKDPNNKNIIFYTHGDPTGTLELWTHGKWGPGNNYLPVTKIIKPDDVKGKNIYISACYPNVTIDPYKGAYDQAGAKLQGIIPKQEPDGRIDRSLTQEALTKFFINFNPAK